MVEKKRKDHVDWTFMQHKMIVPRNVHGGYLQWWFFSDQIDLCNEFNAYYKVTYTEKEKKYQKWQVSKSAHHTKHNSGGGGSKYVKTKGQVRLLIHRCDIIIDSITIKGSTAATSKQRLHILSHNSGSIKKTQMQANCDFEKTTLRRNCMKMVTLLIGFCREKEGNK